MTSTEKSVARRTTTPHSRHHRRIIVSIIGDTVGFRLEREKSTRYLPIEKLYDQAELRAAQALNEFDAGPCSNPKTKRNV